MWLFQSFVSSDFSEINGVYTSTYMCADDSIPRRGYSIVAVHGVNTRVHQIHLFVLFAFILLLSVLCCGAKKCSNLKSGFSYRSQGCTLDCGRPIPVSPYATCTWIARHSGRVVNRGWSEMVESLPWEPSWGCITCCMYQNFMSLAFHDPPFSSSSNRSNMDERF